MVRKTGSLPCCAGFNFYRNALVLLNLLYIAVACALIALAAFGKSSVYIADFSLFGGIIACGVFLLMIALVGLTATMLHHQVTLFFYMTVLILLFIVQLSVACACLASRAEQQKAFFESAWMRSSVDVLDEMQEHFNCCAPAKSTENASLSNSSDIICSPNNNTLPRCTSSHGRCCGPDYCSYPSCWDVIACDVGYALKAAGFVGLFFSFTEIFGVWLAFRFRNQKNPKANPNNFL